MSEQRQVQWVSSVDAQGRIAVRALSAGCVLDVREELSGWSVRLIDADGHARECGSTPTLDLAKVLAVTSLEAELLAPQ